MTTEYQNSLEKSNSQFDISDYVEFDRSNRAVCPNCQKKDGYTKKSLSRMPSGAYKCHRCNDTQSIREALGVPKNKQIPTALAERAKPEKKHTIGFDRVQKDTLELLNLNKSTSTKAIRYLANRGITTDLIKSFNLGLARCRTPLGWDWGISVPIPCAVADGEYYQKKRVAPWNKELVKHENYQPWKQYQVPCRAYFTHKPKNASETYLCEGEWDAIMLGWLAKQNNAEVAVATFTQKPKDYPLHELERLPGTVTIFFDRDSAGENYAKKLASQLGDRGRIAIVPAPENYQDGWDVSDAINAKYGLEDFERAAIQAEQIEEELEILDDFEKDFRTWEEIYDTAPDYVEWLVPDLLTPNELFCLAAEPRAGKSLFAMGLAKAVASGGKFLGRPCPQGEVLYICKEDADVKVKKRLIAQQWEREQLRGVKQNNKFTLENLPKLAAYVKKHHPALIIIDTLSRVQSNNSRENSSEMNDVLAPLQELAHEQDVCILVVHHTRKKVELESDLLNVFDNVRGSSTIRSTCRGMLVIAEGKDGFRLCAENGYTDKQDLKIVLNRANLTWILQGIWTPPSVNLTQEDLVYSWLKKHQQGTVAEICDNTLVPQESIYKLLIRLMEKGKLKSRGRQRNRVYYLPVGQVWQDSFLPEFENQDSKSNRDRSLADLEKNNFSTKSDRECKETLQPDRFLPDHSKNTNSARVETKEGSKLDIAGNMEVGQSLAKTESARLKGKKPIGAIGRDLHTSDRFGDTTNFFEEKRSGNDESKAPQEKGHLVGCFHKKHGYLVIINRQGSKLTVRQPGLTARQSNIKTVFIKAVWILEYENCCDILDWNYQID